MTPSDTYFESLSQSQIDFLSGRILKVVKLVKSIVNKNIKGVKINKIYDGQKVYILLLQKIARSRDGFLWADGTGLIARLHIVRNLHHVVDLL